MSFFRSDTRRSVPLWALSLVLVVSVSPPGLARAQSAIEQLEEMTGATLDFGTATSQASPQNHPMPGFHPMPGRSTDYAQEQVWAAQRRAQSLVQQADLLARQGNYSQAEALLAEAHRLWPDNGNIHSALLEMQDNVWHKRADRQLGTELNEAESKMQAVERQPIMLPGVQFAKLPTAPATVDNYPYKNDSSVVDLRSLGAGTGIIDIAHLQGISVHPTSADLKSAQALDQTLAPQEKALDEQLAGAMLASAGNSGAADHRLHNPLDDPLEAYGEQVRKNLLQHAISVAYVRASDQSPTGFDTMRFHLESDPVVARKVSLIEQNLMDNETEVRSESLSVAKTVIGQDMDANHLSDGAAFEAKYQADSAFRQQVDGQMHAIGAAADAQMDRLDTGALVQARIVAEQWVTQWNHRGQAR